MNPRKLVATVTLAASPLVMVGCTGTEVQDFFTSHGHPVSQDFADRVAGLITKFENAKPKPAASCADDDDAVTTTTTTAAPLAGAKAEDCGRRRGRR